VRLTWLASIVVIAWVSVWVSGLLLESRPRYRNVVQVFFVLIALLLIFLSFLHGAQQRLPVKP
jgi:hypothetical protein